MADNYSCPVCGWNYDPAGKSKCPSCYSTPEQAAAKASEIAAQEALKPAKKAAGSAAEAPLINNVVRTASSTNQDALLAAIERQIAAADRTTYAVRSMVSYIVISVLSTLLGGSIAAIGLANQNTALLGFGAIILVVGSIGALVSLVNQWAKSSVPQNR